MLAACSRPPAPDVRTPVIHAFDSETALAQAVLDGLAANDREGLRSLALSEAEFRDQVWPELPTSRPERNMPLEYVWGQLEQRSDASLSATLGRYGGQRLALRHVSFTGETTQYQSFAVHRGSKFVVTDDAGAEVHVRLFGSAMVKDGRYKLFSFVVSD
jgi:hypothetical protein